VAYGQWPDCCSEGRSVEQQASHPSARAPPAKQSVSRAAHWPPRRRKCRRCVRRMRRRWPGCAKSFSTAEDHAPAHWRPQPSSKLGGAGGVGGALRAAVRKLGACTSVSGGLRQCARARRRAFQRSPRSTADAMTDEHSRAGADAPVENCSRGTVFMNTARHPPAPGAVALLVCSATEANLPTRRSWEDR
jgi:hypothetical protein